MDGVAGVAEVVATSGRSKRAVSATVDVLVVTHKFPGVTRRHDDRGADLQRHAKCDGVTTGFWFDLVSSTVSFQRNN